MVLWPLYNSLCLEIFPTASFTNVYACEIFQNHPFMIYVHALKKKPNKIKNNRIKIKPNFPGL